MLRGNAPARIDDKGRLKVPNAFRVFIQETYGRELFVTSVGGENVRIYPLPVWQETEQRLAQMPQADPSLQRYRARVSFYGQQTEIDPQGRVLIQPRLRESAQMVGEVDVLGQQAFLEVWNHERFIAGLLRDPFTEADARALAGFGI